MSPIEDDRHYRNCCLMRYILLRANDCTMVREDSAVRPESDGSQKYFHWLSCRMRNLAMLVDEPPGSYYDENGGFVRSWARLPALHRVNNSPTVL